VSIQSIFSTHPPIRTYKYYYIFYSLRIEMLIGNEINGDVTHK